MKLSFVWEYSNCSRKEFASVIQSPQSRVKKTPHTVGAGSLQENNETTPLKTKLTRSTARGKSSESSKETKDTKITLGL